MSLPRRPRFSRWRRLPGIFRTGERRPIDSGTELDRLILYVPARILDLAEELAERAGAPTVQDYCALLLMHALENERVQQKVADFEARRGPLEGLKQIADDPAYLVEWQEQSDARPDGVARRDREAGTTGPVPDDALLIELPGPAPEVPRPRPESSLRMKISLSERRSRRSMNRRRRAKQPPQLSRSSP